MSPSVDPGGSLELRSKPSLRPNPNQKEAVSGQGYSCQRPRCRGHPMWLRLRNEALNSSTVRQLGILAD